MCFKFGIVKFRTPSACFVLRFVLHYVECSHFQSYHDIVVRHWFLQTTFIQPYPCELVIGGGTQTTAVLELHTMGPNIEVEKMELNSK